ncbi:hypothetical protein [Asticcacaulis taihuensis]|uniref:hypothetical protein n=1 Tax=Asticcacaulis taihuensis TaxID=260084 RepID=UPI0026EDD69B|nr:hypothetical protein [Asticcacaulis taihuensis]
MATKKTSVAGALAGAAVGALANAAQAAATEIAADVIDKAAEAVKDNVTDAVAGVAGAATEAAGGILAEAAEAASDISAIPDGTPVNKLGFHLDRFEEVLAEFFKEASADVMEVGNALTDLKDRVQRLPGQVVQAVTG